MRTPIQWNDAPNGGFTTGEPWIKVNPNYTEINAAAAVANKDSIFHFYKRLIALRKEMPVLVYGNYKVVDDESNEVYAYTRELEGEKVLVLLNFSDTQTIFSPNVEINEKSLIIGNYKETDTDEKDIFRLQPWESRVYKLLG